MNNAERDEYVRRHRELQYRYDHALRANRDLLTVLSSKTKECDAATKLTTELRSALKEAVTWLESAADVIENLDGDDIDGENAEARELAEEWRELLGMEPSPRQVVAAVTSFFCCGDREEDDDGDDDGDDES